MDMTTFQSVASFLSSTGQWGLLAVLGIAFWRLSERKDKDMQALYEKLIELSESQTSAITKMEGALTALKDALVALRPANG
jgi:hypothetical protein